VARTQERRLSELPQFPNVLERFPLPGLAPANYTARVTLLSDRGMALAADEAPFYISPVAGLPRPWVLSLPQPSSAAPQYWNDLGNQYLLLGRKAEARERLERAYHLAPQTPRFVLDFCRMLMEQRDFRQAKDVALRAAQSLGQDPFLLPLAQAAQALGEFPEAADYYGRHIAHAGPSVRVLNALGECQLAAGDRAGALQSWEKSLQLDGKQAQLTEKIAALKRGAQ
jgi:tetratricopeptide (TPR) repeat protein